MRHVRDHHVACVRIYDVAHDQSVEPSPGSRRRRPLVSARSNVTALPAQRSPRQSGRRKRRSAARCSKGCYFHGATTEAEAEAEKRE